MTTGAEPEDHLWSADHSLRNADLQYVPPSKPFDHAWFEAQEVITLYCKWSGKRDPVTGNFKAIYFCRILDKFTRRTKPIRIIGDPDYQRPDKWSSAVAKVRSIALSTSNMAWLSEQRSQ